MSALLDATTTPFSLSVLTATKGNASKRLIADVHGRPVSDPNHTLAIATGHIQHVQLAGLVGLRDLLSSIAPADRKALVHGIPKGSRPDALFKLVTLATIATLTKDGAPVPPDTLARSLDYLAYPEGVYLSMFDVDPYPEATRGLQSAQELIQQLAQMWPVFAEGGWLATVSTSSAIRDKKTQEWLKPPTGFHVYVLVTGDVARFREIARVRLWLAGTGWCKLASPNAHTGVSAVLERCLVDLTVFSPERLDYVAGALIAKSAPFYQDRPDPVLHPGAVLDLDALPEVTDEERQQYQALVNAARARLTLERVARVRDHIQRTTPTLQDEALTQEISARLERTDDGILTPDHPLLFARGSKVTAGTVTADLDSQRLADPFEPDYGPSHAVFHWREGHWLIVSFAHGIKRVYCLAQANHIPPEPDPDEPCPEAPQPHAHQKGDHSTIAATLARRFRDTLAFDTGRKAWMQYGAGTPGIWGELSEEAASDTVRAAMEALVAGPFRGSDLASVETLLRTHLYHSLSTGPTGWLPFPNGALELASMTCHAHTPARTFTW